MILKVFYFIEVVKGGEGEGERSFEDFFGESGLEGWW